MQCQHAISGHCGKCARIVYKSEGLTHTKEHKKVKNTNTYMTVSPEDIETFMKNGWRFNSRTHGRIIVH